jgi:hypothetical protein
MMPKLSAHLSEEALDDLLIGLGSAESQAHLARCIQCRAKVEEFDSDLSLFNQTTMAWSDAQPVRKVQVAPRNFDPIMPFGFASALAAIILAVAVGIPLWHHEHSSIAIPATEQATIQFSRSQIQDSQAQIAQDNELMAAVNAAISPQDESPVEQYGLSENPGTQIKAHPK